MELRVSELNGKKVYKIKDDLGLVREVTPDFVKFAINNGELTNCYIDSKGNIFTSTDAIRRQPTNTNYKLLGKLLDRDENTIGFLLQHKETNKVLKSPIETFNQLVERDGVDGAFVNEQMQLCLLCSIDEYQLVTVDGKTVPRKIQRKKQEVQYTMQFGCAFDDVLMTLDELLPKLVRGTGENDKLGTAKGPDIFETRMDGIVVQIDNTKIPVKILNRQDIIDDVADYAELSFECRADIISLRITDINYKLNSLALVAAVFMAYKKLANNFAEITDIMISGVDRYYWSATVNNTSKTANANDSIKRKTKSDITIIQGMYNLEKTQATVDLPLEMEKTFIQGLKLGTCNILINCVGCGFTSTGFRLDYINREVYMKFQSNDLDFAEEISYKGKNVDNLTPIMACIIAATTVAEQHTITRISILDSRTNNEFELIFKLKSSHETHNDLMGMLNK